MIDESKESIGNPLAVGIVVVAIAIFLVFVLIPQNFWVDLSITLFP